MTIAKNNNDSQICAAVKNGKLEFHIRFSESKDIKKAFIIRRLKVINGRQRLSTEQHTLISSHEELVEWVSGDEYFTQHPELFDELTEIFLKGGLP